MVLFSYQGYFFLATNPRGLLVLGERGLRVLQVLLGRRQAQLLVRDPRLLVVPLRPAQLFNSEATLFSAATLLRE